MDGFFVAKLKVGRPQKGVKKQTVETEGSITAGTGIEEETGADDVRFNDEEDRPYLEGQNFLSFSSV